MKEKFDYEVLEAESIEHLEKNRTMVLATCSTERVTARMMSTINQGLTVYFQVDRDSTKFRQISENPNVALCASNMQLEGIARVSCHPLEDPFFIEKYRQYHEGSFNTYSHLNNEVIIEVQPRLITFWKYDTDHKPYRDFLDIRQREAFREYYPLE